MAWRISYPECRTRVIEDPLDDLIVRSDLIVRGRVVDEKTRLSPDEYHVWTDYTVEVLAVFKDAQQMIQTGSRIIVTRSGGNIILEGKPVREDTPWFPPLRWIAPHILFIVQDPAVARNANSGYSFTCGEIGVYELSNGRVVSNSFGKKNHRLIGELHNQSEVKFVEDLKSKITSPKKTNPVP
ncbi:MAG TPA: hypothetical protein VNN18_03015 [Candidatus Xenobia bacterium]|nr:hypothetical protein [Candidatus Xenobia bacterium]